MTTSIACYVRVSSESQNLDGQIAEIKQWLKGNGHDPEDAQWYIDHGESGKKIDGRPAIDKLSRDVFSGSVKSVAVFKLDRIARNLRDGVNLLTDWLGKGVRIVSVREQFDFSGSVGQLIMAVLLSLAQIERESILERQRAGIEVAKKKGRYQGRQRGTFKASPSRAVELRQRGLTGLEIAEALGVSRMTVHRYLRAATK
jgi:DNA invertase Pin-like site-specific DNA recombinase